MRPKWPRSRAAEQRDELAPLHCRMPPVLSTKRNSTPRSGRRLLGCGISAGPWVKLRSHVSEMARPLYLQQRTYLMTVDGRYGRVEDGRGSLGHAATLRFPSPLIEPDVRISRIRLSDWLRREAHGKHRRPQASSRGVSSSFLSRYSFLVRVRIIIGVCRLIANHLHLAI